MSQELVEFTHDQVELIKNQIAVGCSNDELSLFIQQCKRTGLDPFSRQIYAIQRKSKNQRGEWISKMSIQTSIDGFRVIAQRSGQYAGQLGPFWCDDNGDWKDVWILSQPPKAAKVAVLRHDFKEPLWGVAVWESYTQNNTMWQKMPDLMLAKVAEALALRKAFPNDLSGLYTSDEISENNNIKLEPKNEQKIVLETTNKKTESAELTSELIETDEPKNESKYVLQYGPYRGILISNLAPKQFERYLTYLKSVKSLDNAPKEFLSDLEKMKEMNN